MTDIEKKINEYGLTEIAKAAGLDASKACRRDYFDREYLKDGECMVVFSPEVGGAFEPRITYWPADDTVNVSQHIGECSVSMQGAPHAVLAQLLRLGSHEAD